MITALLVRWGNGWREVVDAGAVAARGRHEALLGLGSTESTGEVDRLGTRQLAVYADARTEITAGFAPRNESERPYSAFAVADTIAVPDIDGSATPERVVALTVTEDENGTVTYAPELKDVLLSAGERVEQAIKKMSDGTLRGQSKVAAPVGSPSTKPSLVRPLVTVAGPAPAGEGAPGSLTLWAYQRVPSGTTPIAPQQTRLSPGAEGVLTWSTLADDTFEVVVHGNHSVLLTCSMRWYGIAGPGMVRLDVHTANADEGFNQTYTVGPFSPETMGVLTNSGDAFTASGTWVFSCNSSTNFVFDVGQTVASSFAVEFRVSFVLLEYAVGPQPT